MKFSITISFVISLTLDFVESQTTSYEEAENSNEENLRSSLYDNLMTRDKAIELAKILSTFKRDARKKIQPVNPRHDELDSFVNVFKNNAAAIGPMSRIVASIKYVKNIFDRYKGQETNTDRLAKDLRNVDAETTRIYMELSPIKPNLFDILALNKDPRKNCVTHGSSVVYIEQLYSILIYVEIETTAIGLYALRQQSKSGKPDNVAESAIWDHFNGRMNVLQSLVSDAFDTVAREMKKC